MTSRSFRTARSGVVLGTSLLLVTTAVFPATSSYAAPGRAVPSVPGCRGEAVRGVFAQVPGSWGMGHVEFKLRLTNRSTATCRVPARPSLQLIGHDGEPLPTHVAPWPPSGAVPSVALRPETSAVAPALVAVDIPGPGDSHRRGGPCQPAAVELRVGTAGKTFTVLPVQPATSVCQRGSILLKSLVVQEPEPKIPSALLALVRGQIRYPPCEYTLTVRYYPRTTGAGQSGRSRRPGQPTTSSAGPASPISSAAVGATWPRRPTLVSARPLSPSRSSGPSGLPA